LNTSKLLVYLNMILNLTHLEITDIRIALIATMKVLDEGTETPGANKALADRLEAIEQKLQDTQLE